MFTELIIVQIEFVLLIFCRHMKIYYNTQSNVLTIYNDTFTSKYHYVNMLIAR